MGVVWRAMRIQVQVREFSEEMAGLMLEAHFSQMSSSDNSCPGNGVEEISLLSTPWSLSAKFRTSTKWAPSLFICRAHNSTYTPW